MLQVARLAPKALGDARELVTGFILGQLGADGGFSGRAGESDLYYTVFGLESLIALGSDLPSQAVAGYLRTFGDGSTLDFVHLTCLARAWADLPRGLREEAPKQQIRDRLESHRTGDGGYHAAPDAETGNVYGCFLALGAYQDLGLEMPDPTRMVACLREMEAADGGFANQSEQAFGLTPATAGAVMLLRHLGQNPGPGLAQWLLSRRHPGGGFFASPAAPVPDLLSTATALHALAGMQVSFGEFKDSCLDFIDTLWTNRGGFYGNWQDDILDCEYTYYALLSLGHLTL
jgi:prenyltransferase beta subunit